RVLRLPVLDPLDADIAAAERGIIVHEALERFVKEYRKTIPHDALDRLLAIGREVFDSAIDRPGVAAFWWPRFQRIAQWFVEHEHEAREGLKHAYAEARGEILITEGLARPIRLVGKADRIDLRDDGTLDIIDYKTGTPPSIKQVQQGLAPQLPLEAAMASRGGFTSGEDDSIPALPAGRLIYLRLTGGETAGERREIKDEEGELAKEVYQSLIALLKQYEDEQTPYLSRPRVKFLSQYGDYDHLARVKEWASAGGEGE
ncbi:PD-(D/E)XK nuclease family protein, partial [Parvibaculum sp.]|uniref:PD-(D/E)XK nuclease family protein n=1 Tax=Parvibaculum sp. TaxID=2024848 RepID=UPI003C71147C